MIPDPSQIPAEMGGSPQLGRTRTRRLSDYLATLRGHWFVFLLAFLAATTAVMWSALYKTPPYLATATVEVTADGGGGRFLPGYGVEATRKIENEIASIKSLEVARAAAADRGAHLTSTIIQEDAHRALDTLMREYNRGRRPCLLDARCTDLPVGNDGIERYRLRFSATDGQVDITRLPRGPTVPLPGFQFEKAFRVDGRSITIFRKPEDRGEPRGSSFILTLRSPEAAARWIYADVYATPVGRESDLLRVGFTGEDPELSRNVADALAASYLASRLVRYQEDLQSAISSIDSQVGKMKGELIELERQRDEFVQANNAVYLSSEKVGLLSAEPQRSEQVLLVEQALKKLDQDQQRLHALEEKPLDSMIDEALSLQPDPLVQALWTRLREIRRTRLAELSDGTMKADHPAIKKLDVQADQLEKEIRGGLANLFRMSGERFERMRLDLKEQHQRASDALLVVRQRLAAIPGIERELSIRQRRAEAKRSMLDSMIERQATLQIIERSNNRPARIIDQAFVGEPQQSLVKSAVFALLLGLLAGALGALGIDALRGGIRDPEEIEERLGIPVYASVPDYTSAPRAERRGIKTGVVAIDRPHSPLSEPYWLLRAKILFSHADRRLRSLAVTSATELEGKTATALNLGVVLAQSGARVVIVDGDMRRPRCHERLGLEVGPGLYEVLTNATVWRAAIQQTSVPNLSLIPAGAPPTSPAGLLGSSAVYQLVEDLKETFDYVIFDLPPVLAVADSAAAFRQIDGVLLVARYRHASIDAVEGARLEIEHMGGRVLGAVFNAYDLRRARSVGRGYGYGYGYGGYGGEGRQHESRTPPAAEAPTG